MPVTKDVFVIMPFSATATCKEDKWTVVYKHVFCPAVEECGYTCERAAPKTGSLISSIVERLKTARIVLADITDRNANVFYELGVRHSLSKRTIIVSQNADDIPSDLRGYWFLRYGTDPELVAKFKEDIRRLISEIEEHPQKCDSPVADYLERENISLSQYAQRENIKKLGALCTELSGNALLLQAMDARAKKPGALRLRLLSADCLKMLLHTMYVDPGRDVLKIAYELRRDLDEIQMGHHGRTLIQRAYEATNNLSNRIELMRGRLARGEYEEPPTVSTMMWESPKVKPFHGTSGRRWDRPPDTDHLEKCIPR